MAEQKWTEAEIREAWKEVLPKTEFFVDDLVDKLSKPKPEDNPVFKIISERLKEDETFNGSDLFYETLAKVCADLPPFLPEMLSDEDVDWLRENTWIQEPSYLNGVDRWLKWRHGK